MGEFEGSRRMDAIQFRKIVLAVMVFCLHGVVLEGSLNMERILCLTTYIIPSSGSAGGVVRSTA